MELRIAAARASFNYATMTLWIRPAFFAVLSCLITANFSKHTKFWKTYGDPHPRPKKDSCKG